MTIENPIVSVSILHGKMVNYNLGPVMGSRKQVFFFLNGRVIKRDKGPDIKGKKIFYNLKKKNSDDH